MDERQTDKTVDECAVEMTTGGLLNQGEYTPPYDHTVDVRDCLVTLADRLENLEVVVYADQPPARDASAWIDAALATPNVLYTTDGSFDTVMLCSDGQWRHCRQHQKIGELADIVPTSQVRRATSQPAVVVHADKLSVGAPLGELRTRIKNTIDTWSDGYPVTMTSDNAYTLASLIAMELV